MQSRHALAAFQMSRLVFLRCGRNPALALEFFHPLAASLTLRNSAWWWFQHRVFLRIRGDGTANGNAARRLRMFFCEAHRPLAPAAGN
jgi:hypothetical protein